MPPSARWTYVVCGSKSMRRSLSSTLIRARLGRSKRRRSVRRCRPSRARCSGPTREALRSSRPGCTSTAIRRRRPTPWRIRWRRCTRDMCQGRVPARSSGARVSRRDARSQRRRTQRSRQSSRSDACADEPHQHALDDAKVAPSALRRPTATRDRSVLPLRRPPGSIRAHRNRASTRNHGRDRSTAPRPTCCDRARRRRPPVRSPTRGPRLQRCDTTVQRSSE